MSKQSNYHQQKTLAALVSASICLLLLTFLVLFEIIPPVSFSNEMRIKQEATEIALSDDHNYFTEDLISGISSDENSLKQTLSEGIQKNIDNMEGQLLPKSIISEFKQSKSIVHKFSLPAGTETPQREPDNAVGERKNNVPASDPGSNFNGNSLKNRKLLSMPKIPGTKEAGVVAVKILVDKNGKVIDAEVEPSKTNTSSSDLRSQAKNAAFKALFEPISSLENQTGIITFQFEF